MNSGGCMAMEMVSEVLEFMNIEDRLIASSTNKAWREAFFFAKSIQFGCFEAISSYHPSYFARMRLVNRFFMRTFEITFEGMDGIVRIKSLRILYIMCTSLRDDRDLYKFSTLSQIARLKLWD